VAVVRVCLARCYEQFGSRMTGIGAVLSEIWLFSGNFEKYGCDSGGGLGGSGRWATEWQWRGWQWYECVWLVVASILVVEW
jgi:hypothetical protein